jgi:hypothetical protein
MTKSRRGQLHHPPNPETQAGKEYAALQAERQGIRDERRGLHETMQAVKDAERRAGVALAELDERIQEVRTARVALADIERQTRDRMREIMRDVIEGELVSFREQLLKATKGVADVLETTRTAIIQHETEMLGCKEPVECLDYIADKIMVMIKADLDKRMQEPIGELILEVVTKGKDT